MPRKGQVEHREILPDPVYNSDLVEKFINCMMWDGKKSTAEGVVYHAFKIIQQKTGDDPLKVFKKAVENVKHVLEVKTRRVGGADRNEHSGGTVSGLQRAPEGDVHQIAH